MTLERKGVAHRKTGIPRFILFASLFSTNAGDACGGIGPTLSGDVISHAGVVLGNVIAHIADVRLIIRALQEAEVQSGESHKLFKYTGQQSVSLTQLHGCGSVPPG